MKPDLFERIESPYFSAKLSIVSGKKQFIKAVESQPEIAEFLELARNDLSVSVQALVRIYELTDGKCDETFENPFDAAIAAYLLVLLNVNRNFAWLASRRVKSYPKNLWWAPIIAEQIRPETIRAAANRATTPIFRDETPFKVKTPPTANRSLVFIVYRLTRSA